MEERSDRMNKVSSQTYIKISDIKTSDNKLVAKLDFSEDIRKYFTTDRFVAEYDKNIEDVDESILVIPPLSTVITVAWATGADIYVKNLDKSYLDSLNKLKQTFKKWYPQFSSSGKIRVQNVVFNEFNNEGYALLFSGGVDSLTSYIKNKEKRPTLITIWGIDIPTNEYKFWTNVKNGITDFANREGVPVHFIKTNAGEIVNDGIFTREYGLDKFKTDWWTGVSHGLIVTGSCAPSTTDGIERLILSAFTTKDYNVPDATRILLDSDISWGDVKVTYDGELSRQEKIKCVLKENPLYLQYLRVCYSQYLEYNCGLCEKCLRTITGLLLEGIDPMNCNFDVKHDILEFVKNCLNNGLLHFSCSSFHCWEDIQKHIPDTIDDTEVSKKYNSKEFFEWFKNFDFSNYEYYESNPACFLRLYYLLKYKGICYTSGRAVRGILNYTKSYLKQENE